MAESERLAQALKKDQGIAVRNVVINQVLDDDDKATEYVEAVCKSQAKCIDDLRRVALTSSASAGGGGGTGVDVTTVPWLDVETTTVYGLRALGVCLLG